MLERIYSYYPAAAGEFLSVLFDGALTSSAVALAPTKSCELYYEKEDAES
jgi:hypothetical protein